jgi:hypothetical protein
LDTKLQNAYRIMAAKKLKQMFNSDNSHNILQKKKRQLKQKVVTGNIIHVQADKGKVFVVRKSDPYTEFATRHP